MKAVIALVDYWPHQVATLGGSKPQGEQFLS